MLEDEAAISRVLSGQTEAFGVLVKRYERSVFCLVSGLIRDTHSREDIAQETFLSAYRHLGTYRPDRCKFSTWLLAIARNRCLNALKKKSPLPAARLPAPATCPAAPDCLEERELFERLDMALAALPLEQKTTFVLCELVGLSGDEVARIEGVRPGTLRSRLSRAKAALRSLLGQFMEGEKAS